MEVKAMHYKMLKHTLIQLISYYDADLEYYPEDISEMAEVAKKSKSLNLEVVFRS